LYPIQIDLDNIDKSRQQVFDELRHNGIGVNVHYIPIHIQPYYENMGFEKGEFPNAENYYECAISIPLFQGLNTKMQDKVVNVLGQAVA
jgi:dTDP-4-amino-4,6-dideoxygalactose transaminase